MPTRRRWAGCLTSLDLGGCRDLRSLDFLEGLLVRTRARVDSGGVAAPPGPLAWRRVVLSGTSLDDDALRFLSRTCPFLEDLDLSGCLRIRQSGPASLARPEAAGGTHLTRLCLRDLTTEWVLPPA